jgi:hypothetical protein
MRCISLWQPWAGLIRRGLKLYETRGWPMFDYMIDQPLAIHAAKKTFRPDDWDDDFLQQLLEDEVIATPLLYGYVLCVVHPQKSIPTSQVRNTLTRRERLYGNYEDRDEDSGRQRYAWPLIDIRVLPQPIPLVGRQMIFDWPEGDKLYKELW